MSKPLKTLFRCGWELLFNRKYLANKTLTNSKTFQHHRRTKLKNLNNLPAKYVDCNCIESKADENKNWLDNQL